MRLTLTGPRCNNAAKGGVGLSTCLCLHAEENALLEAGRDRIGETAILYCNTCPCLTCSVKITQVGISEVVYNQGYLVDDQTARIFAESGVRLRQFSPPADGLVDLSLDLLSTSSRQPNYEPSAAPDDQPVYNQHAETLSHTGETNGPEHHQRPNHMAGQRGDLPIRIPVQNADAREVLNSDDFVRPL